MPEPTPTTEPAIYSPIDLAPGLQLMVLETHRGDEATSDLVEKLKSLLDRAAHVEEVMALAYDLGHLEDKGDEEASRGLGALVHASGWSSNYASISTDEALRVLRAALETIPMTRVLVVVEVAALEQGKLWAREAVKS